MSGNKLIGAAVGLAALFITHPAQAAPESRDSLLIPIEGGYMHGMGKYLGRPTLQVGTVSSGLGYALDRVGLMAFGRAGMGPNKTRLGWGGVRGYYSLLGGDQFEIGPDLSITAGGGKINGKGAGLAAAVEPGISTRFVTYAAGAFELKANWYQPLAADRAWGGAAMLSLAWHPVFENW